MPSTLRFLAAALLAAAGLLLPAIADDTPDAPSAPTAPAPPPHEPIPPAPAGLILDQAHVLLPEAAAALSARLVAARAADVHVYVVTVRSLGVPSSKQGDQLQETVRDFLKAWLPHEVGAVILFDDESGLMTVELSKETDLRFAGFAVERDLRELLAKTQESGLAREKLERTAQVVAETLRERQITWAKAARKERTANLIMGTVALLGLGLIAFSVLGKPKGSADAAPSAPPRKPASRRFLKERRGRRVVRQAGGWLAASRASAESRLLGGFAAAGNPVERLAAGMSHSQNPQSPFPDDVR